MTRVRLTAAAAGILWAAVGSARAADDRPGAADAGPTAGQVAEGRAANLGATTRATHGPTIERLTAQSASNTTVPLGPAANRGFPSAPAAGTYSVTRVNEDYALLRDPANRTDPFDPLKRIPFGHDPNYYLTLGFEARERYEQFNNLNFGRGPEDNDGYFLTRLIGTVDVHLGPNVRLFTTLKSSQVDNRVGGPRGGDADEFDVDQALAQVSVPLGGGNTLTFTGGRQYLVYGWQRLIGIADWRNTRQTFDGFRLSLASKGGPGSAVENYLDGFWTRPAVVNKEQFNNDDHSSALYGIYDTVLLPKLFGPKAHTGVDAYFIGLGQKARPALFTSGPIRASNDTYTVGTRVATAPMPWDVNAEASYQFGRTGSAGGNTTGGRINAYAVSTDAGFTLVGAPFAPRGGLAFDLASGDHDRANPDRQTFNQLYPPLHVFFGFADVIGRQNTVDLHPSLTATFLQDAPAARLVSGRAEYHLFWRQSVDDDLYATNGSVQRRTTAATRDPYVGSEIDLLLNWQVDPHLSVQGGYSHFFTGGFLRQTGASEGLDFAYGSVLYVF